MEYMINQRKRVVRTLVGYEPAIAEAVFFTVPIYYSDYIGEQSVVLLLVPI